MIEINAALIFGLAGALSAAVMGALAFAMSRAPGWRELRSFALLAMAAATYCLLSLVHVVRLSPDKFLLGERLLFAASFAYGMALIRHLAVADQRPLRRGERWTIAIGLGMIVLALVPGLLVVPPIRQVPVEWIGVTYTMATGTTLALVCIAFMVGAMLVAAFGGGRRWRHGWNARLPMIGTTTLAAAGVSDTLASLELIPAPQLIEGFTVVIVGVVGVLYARRFVADARRLEALSTRLEQEVATRTHQLLQAQARAAEHERLAGLGRIAAGVAHEINNPTAVLQQNLERLRSLLSESAAWAPELEDRFQRSRAATRRIAEIVRQLLDTAREAPVDRATATVFAVAEVVDKAIVAAAATAPELRVSASIAAELCVRGDQRLLEQALINLLVNAADATRDARGGGQVHIQGIRDGERVRLTVKDNGAGIPPAFRDRLFEPFATTKPVGQGTGLGLAVSRGLMTSQGGTLFVASSTELGTEMALELPAADPSGRMPAEAGEPEPPNVKRDLRVLLIEDNDDMREVLELHLEMSSLLVDAVASVVDAIAKLADGHRYDVVICDLMMPGGGAESWLAGCASFDAGLADRTILMTGGPTTPEAVALVAARRDRVIFKPFEMADLQRAIGRVATLDR